MKNRIKALKAQVTESILELGNSPVSVAYSDMDDAALKCVLCDAITIARDTIDSAFVEELNS